MYAKIFLVENAKVSLGKTTSKARDTMRGATCTTGRGSGETQQPFPQSPNSFKERTASGGKAHHRQETWSSLDVQPSEGGKSGTGRGGEEKGGVTGKEKEEREGKGAGCTAVGKI